MTAVQRPHQLFLLNLALQLFDGVATLQGLTRWDEANPLVRAAMDSFGTIEGLLLLKVQACICLLILYRLPRSTLTAAALGFSAVLYLGVSFVPWMTCLLSLAHL